uniref:Uncharacterized protein n=1 Tax=Emiliania huxleyi TaxID=2903 RepID=A0A7S3X6K2_EMIHU|mmetsp:Transcript_27067/g.80824  ORF Transcript_27067/g.80824 Transcript_27067/m.80824 type:complete len:336 (-) Transcript_27067:210-1217(-)
MVVVVDPLYVSLFVDDPTPLAMLLVHDAAYFQFGTTEVIETPSAHAHLRHKKYSHLNGACVGVLDDMKPSWRTWTRGDPHVAWVYVVGELPQSELSSQGARTGLLDGQHSSVSPLAATRRISVRRSPDGTGRWVPAHVLRPFVPAGVPDTVAVQRVCDLIAKCKHHSGGKKRPMPEAARFSSTKRRAAKIHTKDGMMYFVDRLGPLPHEIVRTEMRGPPGHTYKVLCMRPVEPTGATCEALGLSPADATSVAPEAFVQKNELVYLRERFGQLWYGEAENDGALKASLCEAVSRFAASYAKQPISAARAFRSLAKCPDATPTPHEFAVLNPETQSD